MSINQFRQSVYLRDKHCLVTGVDENECDAAHIIPHNICDKYAPQFSHDTKNGLLLNKCDHTLYDRFYWTFDIYDLKCETKGRYKCRLIVNKTGKNLTIKQYQEEYIEIPLECYPYLYVHYQMYIIHNYREGKVLNMDQEYQHLLFKDRVFRYLRLNQTPVHHLMNNTFRQFITQHHLIRKKHHKDEHYVNAIIRHRTEDDDETYYLIWWDHLPKYESTWEPEKNLTQKSLVTYRHRVEEKRDADFVQN
jgi:hypothetical protein